MQRLLVLSLSAVWAMAALALPQGARAADNGSGGARVEDVVAACEAMIERGEYCVYEATADGIAGCTGLVCFDCPADGSRTCHQTTRTHAGGGLTGPAGRDLLATMQPAGRGAAGKPLTRVTPGARIDRPGAPD